MKSERLNNVILLVSAVVFILQSIGYFAPAWFIKEILVIPSKHGMVADERNFKLPYWDEMFENGNPTVGSMSPDKLPGFDNKNPLWEPIQRTFNKNDTPTHIIERRSINTASITHSSAATGEDESKKKDTGEGMPSENKDEKSPKKEGDSAPGKPVLISDTYTTTETVEKKDSTSKKNEENKLLEDKHEKSLEENSTEDPNSFPVIKADSPGKATDNQDEIRNTIEEAIRKGITKKRYILYVSAGMWYSRACIYPASSTSGTNSAKDSVEWCAFYLRTDDRTLGRNNNMFELRVETTIALAASLLSLILASTGCCSHRRYGARAIASLSTMFLSGALMAVPVVHVILGHIQLYGHVMGRERKNMTVHHLFEHYSVIVCGIASLLAILSTVVITIIKCRSNSSPSNWYDITHDNKTTTELPINWVHNTKTTVPAVTMIKEIIRDETESGYCEMPEDDLPGSSIESAPVADQTDANEFAQLELVPSELETFEM